MSRIGTLELRLSDVVLALLSFASQKGVTSIPFSRFYGLMETVVVRFPAFFPRVTFSGSQVDCYSNELDSAMQHWLDQGVEIATPDSTDVTPQAADRYIDELHQRYGRLRIDSLIVVADYLITQMKGNGHVV
jgi:hypothetical protein